MRTEEKSETYDLYLTRMDEMGKIFRKTKDGKPCYYSELTYFETNDL